MSKGNPWDWRRSVIEDRARLLPRYDHSDWQVKSRGVKSSFERLKREFGLKTRDPKDWALS